MSVIDSIVEFEGSFPVNAGECRDVPKFSMEPGGEGNMLIAFTRLGGNAIPVGTCGSDSYGSFLVGALQNEGICTDGLFRDPDYKCAVSTCIRSSDGRHTFLTCEPKHTFHHQEEAFQFLDTCRALYLTGYNLYSKQLVFGSFGYELVKHACENGIKVIFDTGPLLARIDPADLEFVLSHASVLAMNDEEAELITGRPDPEQNALALSARYEGIIIVKAGRKGAFIAQNGEGNWHRGFPVETVDTMGCGDCFLAGFSYGYLNGWSLDDCASLANAEGAVKASKKGTGTKVPYKAEIEKLLEANGYDFPELKN